MRSSVEETVGQNFWDNVSFSPGTLIFAKDGTGTQLWSWFIVSLDTKNSVNGGTSIFVNSSPGHKSVIMTDVNSFNAQFYNTSNTAVVIIRPDNVQDVDDT